MELASERTITGVGYIKANTAYLYNSDRHLNYLIVLIIPMILIIMGFIPIGLLIRLSLFKDKIVIYLKIYFLGNI